MRDTKQTRLLRLAQVVAQRYGVTGDDLAALLRCEKALSRWAEAESNGEIERDEETGLPYRYVRRYTLMNVRGEVERVPGGMLVKDEPIPDREASTLKRVAAIVAQYPGVHFYHQTDPRGCMLYLYREGWKGAAIDEVYSSVGTALCA